MSRILLSSYRCDPYGVSEAYSGVRTAAALAERHEVVFATTSFSREALERWLATEASDTVRANLHPLYVPMSDIDTSLGALGSALKPGFYLYEQRLLTRIRRARLAANLDLAWHRTPVSFRSRTRLYTLGVPLVIGPVSGGMKAPPELAGYLAEEGGIYRLRFVDDLLRASRFWMRPFERAAAVLVTAEYVNALLPDDVAVRLVPRRPTAAAVQGSRRSLLAGWRATSARSSPSRRSHASSTWLVAPRARVCGCSARVPSVPKRRCGRESSALPTESSFVGTLRVLRCWQRTPMPTSSCSRRLPRRLATCTSRP
jgi:hypothetical protein